MYHSVQSHVSWLYLVLVADSLEELTGKLKKRKESMDSKALWVNMGKTECMVSDATMVSTRETGKYPCSICYKGAGSNSTL